MRSAGRYAMYSSGISELVLVVKDVRSSARFYEEVGGLIPEKEVNEEWAWFWAGTPGEAQRIALRKGPLLFEQHSRASERSTVRSFCAPI
jgi:hypothetical protein